MALSLPFTLELGQTPEFLVAVALLIKGEVNLNYWILNVDIKIALQANPYFHLCGHASHLLNLARCLGWDV